MDFRVPDMSCGHCIATIEKAITSADPKASVTCDLDARRVRIESSLSGDQQASAIRSAGYEAQPTPA